MKALWWFLLLAGVIGVVIAVSRHSHAPAANERAERRRYIEQDVRKKCAIAEDKLNAFEKRFSVSTQNTKNLDPEKTEWKSVQEAKRDCNAVQALLDPPLSVERLKSEMEKACGELKKRQEAFDRRFPTEESQKNNDEVLNSREWKELQDWTEGCTQAKVQLEEAK